ncbi:sulfurtransferase TusA family protein [Lichenibacterium dinghuense]|uniref:sulfurtransferase TusA family protein n=1 Tax=Lichenibacterium dinghuense TaxID=2895977 RepID=UPI001F215E00|nr:sulfurtransferase TusA family protein [Lichenibacterium sp. 6Y81]
MRTGGARAMADGDGVETGETLDLRGLKCPLPVLRTRRALLGLRPGQLLVVRCTDPLAGLDIPNLVRETGDTLLDATRDARVSQFTIRKA